MIFKRKIYDELLKWKQSKDRKPLIIRGARQVGKSTLIKSFSKEYSQFIELNLERKDDDRFFDLDNVSDIVAAISLRENITLDKNVLFFIDEIQESPKAIRLLRFFYEDMPHLHVICAGSLLEFAIKEVKSFPVGRVQQLVLHPLDFEEFLMAKGKSNVVKLFNDIPIKDFSHQIILDLFHVYAIIGGMPEVIKTYIENDSITGISSIYNNIWQAYKDDIEKYARNDTERKVLGHIVNTAPSEADRITMAGFGNSNYKSREVGEAFQSLHKSRLIQLIYPVTNYNIPLQVDFKRKPRLQFLDTGLLNHSLGIQFSMVGIKDLNDVYRGRIVQHLVYQQIQAQSNSVNNGIHFWVREKVNSNAEVDLVIQHGSIILPIEIKSGAQGRLRSLHQFINESNHKYAIRLLANQLSVEHLKTPSGTKFNLLNLPYYLATRISHYAEWLLMNY